MSLSVCAFPGNEVFAARLRQKLGAAELQLEWRHFPDGESYLRFHEACSCGAPHAVMSKTRLGDRRVQLDVPDLTRWKDRTPVLLDDIISSARTMALAATKVLEAGLRRPVCVGVHGILAADALATLRDAGVEKVVTANTIPHATNEIDVSPLVADGIGKLR